MKEIKYCALTTLSESLKSFTIPAMDYLVENGYNVTLSCAMDESFKEDLKGRYSYFPLDIERGYNLKKTIKSIFVLYSFFRKERFNMIEYGTENVALCASIAGYFARIPIRIYNHWGARYVGLSGFSRILSIWIERLSALCSTDVRQVSPRNADLCIKQRLYPEIKVKVLGKGGTIGVDFKLFDCSQKQRYRKEIIDQLIIPDKAFIFGYVGRIQRDKGINELIQAFKILIEDIDAYLVLVGNIDNHNPIEEENMIWARSSKHVVFTGPVSDVYRYMSAFDVLVHPTYREGFGMVLQEAAAVKTPIITTDIIGPGEFIQNGVTGILIEPCNFEKLYNAMRYLYLDKAELIRFAENAYEYVLHHFERSLMVRRIYEDREMLRKNVR